MDNNNKDLHEIKFHYLTEQNLEQMEKEQSHALMLLGFIGVLMMLSTVA